MDVVRDLRFDDVLADHRLRRPDHVAVVDGGVHVSYRELAERVDALAAALRARGFATGDRLLWIGNGSFRLVEGFLAVARLGGVCCPVGGRQPDDALAAVLDDCAPAIVVSDGPLPARARGGDAWWIPADGVGGYEAVVRAHRCARSVAEVGNPDAPLLMLYAPIPGRRPVGLQVSRGTLLQEIAASALRANTDSRHSRAVHGPLHSIAALVSALAAILAGATLVLSPSPSVPRTLLEL